MKSTINTIRFYCNAGNLSHGMGREEALSWLIRRATSHQLTDEENRVFHSERVWAKAPVLFACGNLKSTEKAGFGLLRWMTYPERNACIQFPTAGTKYTAEVKSIYYGILDAMFYRESHIIIYSTNDIAVKVGNGAYSAKKEKKLFDAIRRRTIVTDEDTNIQVSLRQMKDEILGEYNTTIEEIMQYNNVKIFEEDIFQERLSNEIAKI